jgi:putative hydrolase of the HAD superfamily
MYQNYIFDLYGTLVDILTNEKKRSLWEKISYFYSFHGADYQPMEFKKEYLNLCRQEEEKLPEKVYPEIELANVFADLFRKKFVEAREELIKEAAMVFRILSMDYIRVYEGIPELLTQLKRAGKKLYLLSNAQRIFSEPELKALKLYDYFDGILISSDCGFKKPSPRFFQEVLDRYHLDKKESIMIGNDPNSDIKGARGTGLPCLYIHSNLSPKDETEVHCDYSIPDGDVHKIKDLIFK